MIVTKLLSILILSTYLFFSSTLPVAAQNNYLNPYSAGTTVSATVLPSMIGYHFSLFGYTSPQALVNLDGRDFRYQTWSDTDGYFIFKSRPAGQLPLEACLTSQDQLGRISKPVCLPPLSQNYDYNVEIGPIILPPTVSLNKPIANETYFIDNEIILTGQTIPNTNVNLAMFTQNKDSTVAHWLDSDIVQPVEAFSFPNFEARADNGGNFSILLPSSSSKTFRLFAQTNFRGYRSPESFALQLDIFRKKSRLLELLIIALMIILFIYLFRQYFYIHNIASKRTLVVRKHYDLYLPDHQIIIKE